jgi:hypothetical protein
MDGNVRVLLCEDSFDGIMSGVYTAWSRKKKNILF